MENQTIENKASHESHLLSCGLWVDLTMLQRTAQGKARALTKSRKSENDDGLQLESEFLVYNSDSDCDSGRDKDRQNMKKKATAVCVATGDKVQGRLGLLRIRLGDPKRLAAPVQPCRPSTPNMKKGIPNHKILLWQKKCVTK
jgi:hypothetical protein